MTPQVIGGIVILAALAVLGYWIWSTWYKTTSTGTTTGPNQTTTGTTTGTVITAALDTAQLTVNLGYIELLSKINVVKASPDAVKACEVIADVLWQGAIAAWKTAQTATTIPATSTTPVKTAKVTTTDGTVVEVPVS